MGDRRIADVYDLRSIRVDVRIRPIDDEGAEALMRVDHGALNYAVSSAVMDALGLAGSVYVDSTIRREVR